jgi:pimeloyl-ACP methyl ester carboxylesterase
LKEFNVVRSSFFHTSIVNRIGKTVKVSWRRVSVTGCALVLITGLMGFSGLPLKTEASPKEARLAAGSGPGRRQTGGGACVDGTQRSGALYRICIPNQWNGDLVVYAHGYVAPQLPLSIPDDQIGGASISQTVNQLGYAFATTSYSKNGLAIKEGLADVVDLFNIFSASNARPRYVYIMGSSLGGAVAALATEKFPQLFNGALTISGPIGDFRAQINYFGDFRVVFDHFFPGVIPGDPFDIPSEVIANFNTVYVPRILAAITADPLATNQLLSVTKAPIDAADPTSIAATTLGLLFFNVFGSNDSTAELGGRPFDNSRRLYFGSTDDRALNRKIRRFTADRQALYELRNFYETSGYVPVPVVTLHTTADPIVLSSQSNTYLIKALLHGGLGSFSNVVPRKVVRYGHVNVTAQEALEAFSILVARVSGRNLNIVPALAPAARSTASENDKRIGFIDRSTVKAGLQAF